jgi:hypothetical protein
MELPALMEIISGERTTTFICSEVRRLDFLIRNWGRKKLPCGFDDFTRGGGKSCHVGLMILHGIEIGAHLERFRDGRGKKEGSEALHRMVRECHLCRLYES